MRSEKQYLVDEILAPLGQYKTFVIMKYAGVEANAVNQFRREVATLGGCVKMMRKRILARACANAGITLDLAELPGHIGIVFGGKDPIETTKLVFKFSQDTEKAVEVVGGHIEGKLYNGKDVETLSKLPGRDELRAQLLATLEAPMSQTLAVMEALLSSVVYCLDNKAKEG
jgi:large subunit ribosomal protein L10